MATIIVLFNLKEGIEPEDYEAWARSTDLPVVRGLKSVDGFDVFRSAGLFGSGKPAPYEYVEIIAVNDTERFSRDVAEEKMVAVAMQFRAFADNPQFLLTEKLV